MTLFTKITASAIGAFALAGLLAGCDKKASDTTATPTASATTNAPAATGNEAAASAADDANRASGDTMPNDMAERHRQQMDHNSMRQGNQMGPQMGPGASPSPSDSPAAPMKDM